MDTTGTVWPERQRLLKECGLQVDRADIQNKRPYGMNWKMTAKTILVQMHHKAETFEYLNKHLVLIIQSPFLAYMKREFSFDGISDVRIGDPVHIHSYDIKENHGRLKLSLAGRISTDSNGIAQCLGLNARTKVELEDIIAALETKLSDEYRLIIG